MAIADYWRTSPPLMEKSALAGKGGGCKPTSFQLITISTKFLLRGQIHSLYLISTLYVLCDLEVSQGISTTNVYCHLSTENRRRTHSPKARVLVRKLSQLTPLSKAKRANPRYCKLLCGISCELAGCVH